MKKFLVVFSIILIIGVISYTFLNRNTRVADSFKNKEVIITEDKAQSVARHSLNLFESWKQPYTVTSHTFYDLEGTPSAYLFLVNDLYGRAGYLTISASTRFRPVADISTEDNNPLIAGSNSKMNLVAGTQHSYSDVKSEYIYLGGTEYFVKHTIRESSELKDYYFELKNKSFKEIPLKLLETKMDYYKNYLDEDAGSRWKHYESMSKIVD